MRRLTGRGGSAACVAAGAALAALAACAQPGMPPGGPPDPEPPQLVRVTPDSGAVNVRPEEVVFRFDEVVAERPAGATTLEQLVLVSPRDGTPEVRWRRDALSVRPSRGWRENTTYVVQLLPGIADLRGNRMDSTATVVFSTGATIPATRITGVVFDWPRGTAAPNALVQAVVRADTAARDSVVYVVRSDSGGRFVLPFVPPGTVLVRGGLDENRNSGLDAREAWDTVRVALRDSQRVELYAFQHDTVGPRIANVAVTDSVTIGVTLSQPLALDQRLDTSLVRILGPDSAAVPIAAVLSRRAADSTRAAARDTVPRDTTPAPPAPADTAAADTVPRLAPAVPSRPIPVSDLEVRTARPLAPETRYLVQIIEARNLTGAAETSERTFTTPAADTARPRADTTRPPADTARPPAAAPPAGRPPAGAPPSRPPAREERAAASVLPAARPRR